MRKADACSARDALFRRVVIAAMDPSPADCWPTSWPTANANLAALATPTASGPESIPEQYLILVKCRDEKQQVALPERFRREGLECRALLA